MKITITGMPAEGKTTIAQFIEDSLREAGFKDVTNLDDDKVNFTDYRSMQDAKLTNLKHFARKIVIETKQETK